MKREKYEIPAGVKAHLNRCSKRPQSAQLPKSRPSSAVTRPSVEKSPTTPAVASAVTSSAMPAVTGAKKLRPQSAKVTRNASEFSAKQTTRELSSCYATKDTNPSPVHHTQMKEDGAKDIETAMVSTRSAPLM